jgi:hypothetical protein
MHPFTDAVLLSLLNQKQVKASASMILLGVTYTLPRLSALLALSIAFSLG